MLMQVENLDNGGESTVVLNASESMIVSLYNAGPQGPVELRDGGGQVLASAATGQMRSCVITAGSVVLKNTAGGNNQCQVVWSVSRLR